MKMIISIMLYICAFDAFGDAPFFNGNDIYTGCKDRIDNILSAKSRKQKNEAETKNDFCYAVVLTAFTSSAIIGSPWSENNKKFTTCMNRYYQFDNRHVFDVMDMTISHLKNHPEDRDMFISELMVKILHDEFPVRIVCKEITK